MDYFGARYYSSARGRFTSVDPAALNERHLVNPQDWNRYAYTINNPLKFIDPDGQERIQVIVETYIPAKTVTYAGRTFNGNEDGSDKARPVPAAGEEVVSGSFKSQQIVTIETDPSKNGGDPVYGRTSEHPTGITGDTGITYEYDSKGNQKGGPSQASGGTLGGEVTRKDDGSVNIHVHGNEANPKVGVSPGITYNYDIKVTSKDNSVVVTVNGTHDRFPAHVIGVVRSEQPNAKPVVVYSFDPRKDGYGPGELSPVTTVNGQQRVHTSREVK